MTDSLQYRESAWHEEWSFPVPSLQTLAWRDDELVDWAAGGSRFPLANPGQILPPRSMSYGTTFDFSLNHGEYAVLGQRLGTKALLLRNGQLVRELNRSYYKAEAYEFPMAFISLPDGGTGLIHCPREYCRLDIEDAVTGRCLSEGARQPTDFFHSRLAVSPNGHSLLSAGWVWHPWDAVIFFDLTAALRDPLILDAARGLPDTTHIGLAEESAAVWLDDEHVALAASDEPEDEEEAAQYPGPRLRPRGLAVYQVASGACRSAVKLAEPAGTLMAAGGHHVISFYRFPKLIELATGSIVQRWDGLYSGEQSSCICWHLKSPTPLMALDPSRARFAVASPERNHLTIVQLRI